MSVFNCEQCRTRISSTPYGQITQCEHYPITPLETWPRNQRVDFLRMLNELAVEENPVTNSVIRQILKSRIDRNDIS